MRSDLVEPAPNEVAMRLKQLPARPIILPCGTRHGVRPDFTLTAIEKISSVVSEDRRLTEVRVGPVFVNVGEQAVLILLSFGFDGLLC